MFGPSPAYRLPALVRLAAKRLLSFTTIVLNFSLIYAQLQPNVLERSVQRVSYQAPVGLAADINWRIRTELEILERRPLGIAMSLS